MRELQKEVFSVPLNKRTGGREVQVSQMREPEEPARFREFLFQNLQEKLTHQVHKFMLIYNENHL